MSHILEPTVTANQELIVPVARYNINRMKETPELLSFSRRMHEICDDMKLPKHGRQSELGKIFGISQKGARKWLEAESFPAWENVIRITEWANVTVDWLMSGRGTKRPGDIYPTKALAHVATIMMAMEPEKQYLLARLADQVAKPEEEIDQEKPEQRTSGTSK